MDFSKGHDADTQLVSDFDVDSPWMLMIFREENIHFDQRGMTLKVRRNRDDEMPYTMSELQRAGFYGFGRYEVVMRSSGLPGVVTSFFTHTADYHGDEHSEIDFELLGKSPREVHLNHFNGPSNDPETVDLWFDASEGEHLYVFEWMPDSITWFIDGVKVREVTAETSSVAPPTASSRVIANMWVGNRETEEWVGTPEFEEAEGFYRCMSHVPAGRHGPQCSDTFTPPPPPVFSDDLAAQDLSESDLEKDAAGVSGAAQVEQH